MPAICTQVHKESATITYSVNLPGHEERTATATFERTRKQLIEREGDRCWICGRTSAEVGKAHEGHHSPLEWCITDAVDWNIVKAICAAGEWGNTNAQREAAKAFDWSTFDETHPETFVDNMLVNGWLLCKEHHVGKGTGVHWFVHPLWVAQRFVKDGFTFVAGDAEGNEQERISTLDGNP
jgi:hypothetical protein